ncbi:glycosyltransferase family 52 [Basilea psittacipulmonis]|uniref:glycosyltransferase family 52 n=1 Tax=Basilea psittacipulmonis TaxID=1472345 RepID=UPI0013018304|nr:glycosyltransferase family 52 [Basilea psittacipulmonis]
MKNIDIIQTPLIFEDWLLQELKTNPTTQYEIFTFTSTAAINVHRFPHTKIYSLQLNHSLFREPMYEELYRLLKQLNIPIQMLDVPGDLMPS